MPILVKVIHLLDILYRVFFRKVIYVASVIAMISEKIIDTPTNYPYLYSLIYAVLGFALFSYVTIQTNLFMIHSYQLTKVKAKRVL